MSFKKYNDFVNEMWFSGAIPADGAKSVGNHFKKQQKLTYYPDAVSAEVGGPGNPGEVAEEEGPTMLSRRLGDIEPDGSGHYPSQAGQDYTITQPGTTITSFDNMRGEPRQVKTGGSYG